MPRALLDVMITFGRKRHIGKDKAYVNTIGRRAIVIERCEDALDVLLCRIDTDYVQIGFPLTGQGRVKKTLGVRTGPDQNQDLT